jgi:hypothetical protein
MTNQPGSKASPINHATFFVLALLTLCFVVTANRPACAQMRTRQQRPNRTYINRGNQPQKQAPPRPYVPVGAATYIGGEGPDRASALAVLPSGEIIYAGKLTGNPYGVSMQPLLSGTTGAILKLDAHGDKVEALTKLGKNVTDVAVNASTSDIVASGNFGVAVLPAAMDRITWSKSDIGAVDKVAVGKDGHVAALTGTKVTLYDNTGEKVIDFSVDQDRVRDVAVNSTDHLVYVAGDSGSGPSIAYVEAYDYEGHLSWLDWGWKHTLVSAYPSDTYGYRLAVGKNGGLYFEGETHGIPTIFDQDAQSLTTQAPLVQTDAYNKPLQVAAGTTITFIAHLSGATGKLITGSFLLARKADGTALACRGQGGIDADSDGTIYVGGTCDSDDAGKARPTAADPITRAPNYTYVEILSADLGTRKLLTTWGDGETAGVASGYGTAAIAATASSGVADSPTGPLYTYSALQATPPHHLTGNMTCGFLATWSTK